jgi:hypothetical protein
MYFFLPLHIIYMVQYNSSMYFIDMLNKSAANGA